MLFVPGSGGSAKQVSMTAITFFFIFFLLTEKACLYSMNLLEVELIVDIFPVALHWLKILGAFQGVSISLQIPMI